MSRRLQQSQWDFGDAAESQMPRTVYGVSELNRQVKAMLEGKIGTVWVEGEITGLRKQASGHVYFAIKDEGAQLSCALFRGIAPESRPLLNDGTQVLLCGEITLFEARGQYQLLVRKVELKGQGVLQVRFERLKRKLQGEGLFASGRKRLLPEFPARIGLLTSPSGAAIRDVLHVVQERNPSLQIVLEPCHVQGDNAAAEIANGIQRLNRWSARQAEPLDLILMTRGGGSLEDLWAFNEEALVRAVHDSGLPVVSAVGHEIDTLLSDFVADVRAATPSMAAELITQGVFASRGFLVEAASQLDRLANRGVGLAARDLTSLAGRLDRVHPRRLLDDCLQRLDSQFEGLERLARQVVAVRRERLGLAMQRLASLRPTALLARREEQLTWLQSRLANAPRRIHGDCAARLNQAMGQLDLLSPKAVLARGYSITQDARTGEVLRDARKAKRGQVLCTHLHAGEISSTVNDPETYH